MAAGSKKIIIAALLANLGIAIAKFVAAFITNSSAMLAEGVHSLADSANQVFLLIGIRLSQRTPTKMHPYGFGMERYFWSFIVAMTLFAIGATFSIYEGVLKTMQPHLIESVLVNVVVLGISIVLELFSFIAAYKEFNHLRGSMPVWTYIRTTKDPVTITVLFEDSAALLGLLVALCGVLLSELTGNMVFDGLASIIIGIILGAVAVVLAWESKSLLIGEAASDEDIQKLSAIIDSTNGVMLASDIMTMHLSPTSILVNLSLDFEKKLNSDQVETITASLEEQMKTAVPAVTHVFIEASSFVR